MCQNLLSYKKTFKILVFSALALLFQFSKTQAQCTCSGNLVLNPSFEAGTANWGWSGGNLNQGTGAVACGSYSGDFQITNASSNWVSQEIFPTSYAAGGTINVSVWAGTHNNSYSNEVFVDFFDANWNWISNSTQEVDKVLANSPVGPQLYTWTASIPSNVGHITIGFSGTGSWTKTDGWCVTFTANSCNNVTNAGVIGSDESSCGTSFNPSLITNITSPTGGTGTLEYVWLVTTDPGTPAGSTWNVTTIAGANSDTYDPPSITQTTWYRRCARRAGCSDFTGESNWVKKELSCCNCAGNLVQNNSFEQGTYYWSVAGGNLNAGSGAVQCGSYSGDFQITNSSSNGVYQEIYPTNYTQGSILNVSVYAGTHDNTYDNWVGLYFYDANWNWITSSIQQVDKILSNAPAGPQLYNWAISMPANVGHIQVAYGGSGSWTKTDSWCVTQSSGCTAAFTGLRIYDMVGTNNVTITNGGTYVLSSLPSTFNLEALTTGNLESVKFTITGTASSTNIENVYPWNSPASGSSWSLGTGTFTVLVEAFPLDNAAGSACAMATYNFTLTSCDNITAAGTIGYDQVMCGTSGDPALIQSVTDPTGGTGTIEYVWLQSYDGGTTYTTISGATSSTYDPPVISQTTWYRRCARRSGCSSFVGESNWIKKELCALPTANAGTAQTLTCTTASAIIGTTAVSGITYTWSPATGLNASNIAQPTATPTTTTTYTLTATNACGCSATSTVTVTVNKTAPTAVAGTGGTITCTTNTSGIVLGTTTTAGYTYSWSPATALSSTTVSNPTANPTTTTVYTVTVTGSNGCTATSSVNVLVNKATPTADAGFPANLTCSVTSAVLGTNATSGYTYSWSPATALSSTTVSNPTTTATTSTVYTVTVTASNGCTAISTVSVNVNRTAPNAVAGSNVTLTCTNASATLGTTTTAGYTYSWSPALGLNSTTVSNPTTTATSNTTYTVTVTGSNGCTATSSVNVTLDKNPPVAVAGSPVTLTCTTPSATLGTTTTAGYTYSWSPATGLSSTTVSNPTTTATANTTYTVTVTASNGCSATSAVTVTVNKNLPTANAGASVTLTCTTPTATLGTSTTAGYSYSWSPATALTSTTVSNPTTSASAATTYTVTVTGSNGCTASSSVNVSINKTPPTADAGLDATLTCTTPSATIGSTTVAGLTYSWSPVTGLSSASVSNPTVNTNTTTTYTVTVTAANGCTATDAVLVTVNKVPPTANAGAAVTLTCTTPSATLGTSSTAGYSYSWSPATALSSTTISNPSSSATVTTTYTVTVTNSNGCTATSAVTVTVNKTIPTVDAGIDKLINCTTTSVTLGTAPAVGNSYSWSPATGLNSSVVPQPTATPSVTTTYTLTVTNAASSCTATDVVVVTVDNTLPTVNAGTDKTVNCTTTSVTLGTASSASNTYSWSPSTGLNASNVAQPTATPTTTTAYTVVATAANGCTASDIVLVTVNTTPPTADAGPDKTLNCSVASAMIGTAAVSGYSYSWSPATGLSATNIAQPTASPTVTTTYTVTVTNGTNGCTATDVVVVNVNTIAPNAGPDQITTAGSTVQIAGTNPTTGSWTAYSVNPTGSTLGAVSNGVANVTFSNTAHGYYHFIYAVTNGCKDTMEIFVKNCNFTPSIVSSSCHSNGTDNTNTDDYITFLLKPSNDSLMAGKKYTVTATQNGNAIAVYQSDGTPATNLYFGYPSPFKTAPGTAGQGAVTLTITASNGCSNSQTITLNDPGTCSTVVAPCSTGTVTFTYRTPFSTTDLTNTPLMVPKFDTMGGQRKLTQVNVTYNVGLGTVFVAENTSLTSVTANLTLNGSGSLNLNGTGVLSTSLTPINVSNIPFAARILNPQGLNGSSWLGDTTISSNPSTLYRSMFTGLNDYLASIYVNPTQSDSWVTNITGLQSTDDDIQFVNGSSSLTGNATFNALADLNKFKGTGDVDLTASTSASSNFTSGGGNMITVQRTKAYAEVTVTYQYTTECLSLGNLVWNDVNKDGIQNGSETGISGATVYLYNDANNDNVPDGASVATTSTNTNGNYVFNNLTSGNYIVGVVPPTPASGNPYLSSPVNESEPDANGDNNDNGVSTTAGQTFSNAITLTAGSEPTGETPNNANVLDANSNLTLDFGFYQPINLSGNVYVDNNGPANVDGTPTGTAGTTQLFANLVGTNGNVIAVVPVNSNGTFQFNDVQPNTTYSVVLSPTQGTPGSPAPSTTLPNGWSNVSEDCCDNTGNDGTTNGIVTVSVGTTSTTNANFGITEPMSVGNLVWNDANKDGLKDVSESGIQGATVYIYADANSDGTPDGAALQNTTTNANGLYIFNGLTPGNYVIGVVPPTPGTGAPYTSSPVNEVSPNTNGDNNDNGITSTAGQTYSGTITLAPSTEPTGEIPNNGTAPDASSNLTVDFGFYQAINLSGTLFIDNNGSAVIDGTPTGTAGTTQMYVNLVNTSTGLIVGSMPLNTNGTYLFTDVQPNTNYIVVLSQTLGTIGNPAPGTILPDDWVNVGEDCCDNVGNDGTANGILSVSVANSNVINANFGITQKLSLGNLVWNDNNNNGIKDASEVGIANAVVKLYADANGDCAADGAALDARTTDANGLYVFDGLMPGNYIVGVTPPTVTGGTYQSSTQGQEANPNLNGDSNDNGTQSAGSETRSCTVTLLGGTEPTGETPNNGTSGDANSNLTVDFGFYVCPDPFVMNPVDVCANSFIDLATLEPVGFTGGVWSQNGNTVTNLLVNAGTYVYTYTKGTCTATGTQVVNVQVPDYAPTIAITPSIIYGNKPVRVVVTINELLGKSSCTPLYVFVPRLEPRYSFTWNPTATQFGTGPAGTVNNADWQYFTSNPNFYIWKYVGQATFPANGQSKFGYVGTYDPNNTDGETTFSVQIYQGSGGETNLTNNTDSELLIYYRQ